MTSNKAYYRPVRLGVRTLDFDFENSRSTSSNLVRASEFFIAVFSSRASRFFSSLTRTAVARCRAFDQTMRGWL